MGSSRRNFLQVVGTGALATRLAPACMDPDERPADVTIELVVDWISTTMDGLDVRLRSYGGTVPGPTLELRPGDRVEIVIDNRLTAYDSSAWAHDHNVPHDLNTTNLHLHGLDIIPHLFEPVGTDDPEADMVAIAPGEVYTYVFDIPADQPGGLYWYHPHHHGSTAVQAVSGMAGALVVEGPIDEVPEVAAARDIHLVISDIGLFESDATPGVWTYEPVQNAIWNTFGKQPAEMPGDALVRMWNPDTGVFDDRPDLKGGFTTGDYAVRFFCANGVPFYREDHDDAGSGTPIGKPLPGGAMSLELQPGEVVRLRVLNACSDLVIPLAVERADGVTDDLELALIGLDGAPFTAPRSLAIVGPAPAAAWDGVVDYNPGVGSLVLGPGNRAELLIRAPSQPGTYELVQRAHSMQQFLAADRKVVAVITVAGEAKPMNLPTTLPGAPRFEPPIAASELSGTRSVAFTGAFPAVKNLAVGIDFSLGDEQYEVHTINTTVELGAAEAWELSAAMHDHGGNAEGHPFHIHVNSFEVKDIGGVEQPVGTIMDTLFVALGETATVWLRYQQWTGKTVYHCHILPHEDTGMMANLMIKKSQA